MAKTGKKTVKPAAEEEEELEPELDEGGDIAAPAGEALEMYRVMPEAPTIKALLYSEPGVGKTTLAASAQDHPMLAPVCFANIEGGMISIAHRRDIHAVDIFSTEDLYTLYGQIRDREGPFADVRTLVIDNISELHTLDLDDTVRRAMNSGKDKDRNRTSPDEIWQEDYGESTVRLLRLIRWLKGIDGLNLIITAHAKFVYPPSANKRKAAELVDVEPITVLPMLSQKLCKGIMGMMDFVWYVQYNPEDNKRLMLTRPDGIYQAKTRGPHFQDMMGSVVTNPTMPQLYEMLVKAESGKQKRK